MSNSPRSHCPPKIRRSIFRTAEIPVPVGVLVLVFIGELVRSSENAVIVFPANKLRADAALALIVTAFRPCARFSLARAKNAPAMRINGGISYDNPKRENFPAMIQLLRGRILRARCCFDGGFHQGRK